MKPLTFHYFENIIIAKEICSYISVHNHNMQNIHNTESISGSPSSILSASDVVDKLRLTTENISELYARQMSGTTEEFFSEVMHRVVTDLTIIPVERSLTGSEETDNPSDVEDACQTIITLISQYFGKTYDAVETALYTLIESFPVDDVRQAAMIKRTTGLH